MVLFNMAGDGVFAGGFAQQPLLVVEPDASIARVLEIAMQHAGFAVEQTTSGVDAITRLEQGGFAGVLIDFHQPDGDSVQILDWLRQHGEQPPWLVISSMDAADAAQIDQRISERFFSMPFDPWKLIERVKGMTSEEAGGRS